MKRVRSDVKIQHSFDNCTPHGYPFRVWLFISVRFICTHCVPGFAGGQCPAVIYTREARPPVTIPSIDWLITRYIWRSLTMMRWDDQRFDFRLGRDDEAGIGLVGDGAHGHPPFPLFSNYCNLVPSIILHWTFGITETRYESLNAPAYVTATCNWERNSWILWSDGLFWKMTSSCLNNDAPFWNED